MAKSAKSFRKDVNGDTVYGKHYGKTDLERFGIFAEMMYMHGLGYKFPKLNSGLRNSGKQMLSSAPKWKVEGLQDCYFDREFKRLFEGEGGNTTQKIERKLWKEKKEKFLTKGGFQPQKGHQFHSTPGDHFGTFSGKIEAFSPKQKPQEKERFKMGFSMKSSKLGGCGYVDITINKYPEYFSSKAKPGYWNPDKSRIRDGPIKSGWPPRLFDAKVYMPVGDKVEKTYITTREKPWTKYGRFYPPSQNKLLGGMKGGGFSKFPEYLPEKYIDPWKIMKYGSTGKYQETNKGLAPFFPQPSNKSYPVVSPMNRVIDISTTPKNFWVKKPATYKREFVIL
ncbi:UPF0602 protein C4orf47-like [Cimex lectularius]|uniref:Cilia-and flagella-associated protein 96 n=1 Tax=Cimex lectularius TaxID=79782 RepID=A0A8I6RX65_CIMLE|nr:UPF0602 protein C4orf47-like [Cimex lectularius]